LTYLLDHLPPSVHFVLVGRDEPPLPIARYRARRQLFELQAEDLRFELGETAQFLNEQVGLNLSDGEIASLQHQLEGWVAGLQLASLTLQRHRGSPSGPPGHLPRPGGVSLFGTSKVLVSDCQSPDS
jgi:LuxR family maltose regulon positive regulatory protein